MTEDRPFSIQPVIISGGAGRRLWPVSRAMYPKQFQRLHTEITLFQETVRRIDHPRMAPPLVICNEEHRFIAAEQLAEIGVEAADIILEPEGRNTAPAIAIAALWAQTERPDSVLAVLPSDHVIDEHGAFAERIETACAEAASGSLVLLGVPASAENPDYGYIRPAAGDVGSSVGADVATFREKPSPDEAAEIVADGGWLWNTGIVCGLPASVLAALDAADGDLIAHARASLDEAERDLDYVRLAREPFLKIGPVSFDKAVLEPARDLSVLLLDMPWSDASSWRALWQAGQKDDNGNAVRGNAIMSDTRDSIVVTEDRLVTALGVDNLAIVATEDSILVADLSKANDLDMIVNRVADAGGEQHLFHPTIYRPWGSFHSLAVGPRFQVKEIVVKPGASLSLQKHFHRAEHWIVVEGTAKVRCGEREFLLNENESTFIPLGEVHRLENPGKIPIRLIEVQSGTYLGEDDIVRLEDTYGRS